MNDAQKSFFTNFKAKFTRKTIFQAALSVVIAFFLWAYALSATDPLKTVLYSDVPVTLINTEALSAGGLIIDQTGFTIDVRLYGSTIQVARIKKTDIIAVANLASIKAAGTYSIEVSITGLPENISVTEMSNKYLSVTVLERVSSQRDFEIDTTGSPKTGFDVLSKSYDISEVTASGSEEQLAKIKAIRGSISLEGIDDDMSTYAELSAYDSEGKELTNIELNPSGVNVNVQLGVRRAVDVKVQYTGEPTSGASLKSVIISPSRIYVIAKHETFDRYEYLMTENIDISGRGESYTQSAAVLLPEGMIASGSATVTATIDIEAASTLHHKSVTITDVEVRGLSDTLTYAMPDFTEAVLNLASDTEIESLGAERVVAYVDASGLDAGEHTLLLHFTLPEHISLNSTSAETVRLMLSAKPTEPITPTEPTDPTDPDTPNDPNESDAPEH